MNATMTFSKDIRLVINSSITNKLLLSSKKWAIENLRYAVTDPWWFKLAFPADR